VTRRPDGFLRDVQFVVGQEPAKIQRRLAIGRGLEETIMCVPSRTVAISAIAACLAGFVCVTPAAAQRILEAQAVLGEPFGVGRIVVQLPDSMLPEPLGLDGLGISEAHGRVFYPAMRNPTMGPIVKELLNEDTPLTTGGPVRAQVGGILRGLANMPPRTTIHFLFRGDRPLELSLQGRQSIPIVVQPRPHPGLHRRWLDQWWRDYAAAPLPLFQKKADYPPILETYLTSTLARRLNLRLPQRAQTESAYRQFEHELGVLVGSESVRTALQQDRILGLTNLALPADLPLPPTEPSLPDVPEPAADVQVEPMAMHVPAEFFYVRFGSFDNFLWFQDTLDTWGGDLQNLVATRSLDYGRNERLQEQLVLKQSKLSRMLGGAVIADVAIVGTDLLFRDGAAYGFLFQARNSTLLSADFASQRAERVKRGGVTEQKIKIEGQEVSYLSSPDGSVRSYYVVSGDYHFISSSAVLVARFLQTAKGQDSLGASKDFRHLRTIMPLTRNDSVFVYLSDAFLHNITGPRYRIEMLRRLEAVTDIELVLLAKLESATEGKPSGTIAEMVATGILPPNLGPRPDGSRAVLDRGEVYDSLRGRRGNFVPVPDVPVDRITAAERASYDRFLAFERETWGRLEPIAVGIQRKRLPQKQEQVTLDVRAPLNRKQADFFQQWAGPADKSQFAAVNGNLASFEAILRDQRLLGGVQDVVPPNDILDTRLGPWVKLRNTIVGYLGSLGNPGVLRILDLTFLAPPDANGYSRNPLGLWRLQVGDYTLYSFQAEVLASVAPQLHLEPAERPAQVRLHIGDVSNVRLTPFLNNWSYARTRETALGNIRLLHAFSQQLHVPPKDCKDAAELVLAAKLTCPLGGDYALSNVPGGVSRWTSPMLVPVGGGLLPQAPAGYVGPPLSWFRGLDLEATAIENLLSAHAQVIMQLPRDAK